MTRENDDQAYRDHAFRQWASEKPRNPQEYDAPPVSEDTRALHDRALADWARNMPEQPNPYDLDRR